MKRKPLNKRKKNHYNDFSFTMALAFLVLILLTLAFFTGCSGNSQIVKINVPTPCEVQYIPKEPKEIDIENSSIGGVMEYLKGIVKYAKEIRPIINKCVKESSIVGVKDLPK